MSENLTNGKRKEIAEEKTLIRKRKQFKKFLKWFGLIIAGIILFMLGSKQAFHQRGYEAVGGEIFLLLLPAVYYFFEQMVHELAEEIKEDYKKEIKSYGGR